MKSWDANLTVALGMRERRKRNVEEMKKTTSKCWFKRVKGRLTD